MLLRGGLADVHRPDRRLRFVGLLAARRPTLRIRRRAHGDRDGHRLSACARACRAAGRAVSTTLSARNGLLIRDRAAFERARNLTTAVFDKTETLTEGRLGVSDIAVLADRNE